MRERKNPREEKKRRTRKVRGEGREKKDKSPGERESAKPALNGEKGLSPEIGVKRTMNADGVDCEKCWMQVSPVPASDEVCPPVCASYERCSCVFLLVKSAREVPAFRFSRRRMRKMFPVFPPAMLRLRKCDLLEVARELGVEVNGDQPKVEIKDMILQNDKNDMETIKAVTEGILEEKEREFELEKLRIRLRNKLNENKLKAVNRINELANVCILSGKHTAEVSEPVNKYRPLINPVVNKSVENATSRGFEKENCDPPVRGKEFKVNRSSDCDVKMKVGVCEGRVRTVAMGAQRVINPVNIGVGSFELKRDKGVANPEGLICENSCEEKYTLGTLRGCEKQLTVNRDSFRIHTIAKIAGPLKGKEDTCKADGLTCLEDGLAMRLPLSEPREIYKDSLETDNGSNIGSECSFEIDLPGKEIAVPFIVLI
ncbi:uncharacterized protein TNCV_4606351 [Trichonephila clavipes]|nr:uncharacterized protein TNCV_4606351 [Trichonephila clavipes]